MAMKKFILAIVILISACSGSVERLDKNKVYFFYSNGCPHCHDALAYIDKNYASVPVAMVNVASPGGYELLKQTAKDYRISGGVGTPLITFGDKYMLGWGRDSARQFDEYIRPYLK